MDNYVEELNNRIENLYERINKTKNILIAYNLIEKGNSKYQHIFYCQRLLIKICSQGIIDALLYISFLQKD